MRASRHAVVACALILAAPQCVDARMYQWVSASSSTPQLSGEPPPWYRSDRGGPRVRVFENGNLVDDTAIALPAAQREELRAAAFREAEARRRSDVLKRLEQAARREERRLAELERLAEAREQQARDEQDRERAAEGQAATAAPVPASKSGRVKDKDAPLDEDTVARLKAIIADFDRRGGESANR